MLRKAWPIMRKNQRIFISVLQAPIKILKMLESLKQAGFA